MILLALQATGRLRKNAAYFRVNYLVFVGIVTAVCFGFHPTSLIVLAFLGMAWVYLFLIRQAPIVLGGRVFRCAVGPPAGRPAAKLRPGCTQTAIVVCNDNHLMLVWRARPKRSACIGGVSC